MPLSYSGHFGHTVEEATLMANSFGSYLKAASRRVYEPNRQKKFVPYVPHPVDVNLYHPMLHANIIHSAYNSFKAGRLKIPYYPAFKTQFDNIVKRC